MIKPGSTGEAIEEGQVFRLCKLSKDGNILPTNFILSELDKASRLGCLTVWHQELTSVEESVFAMGSHSAKYDCCAYLNAKKIRDMRPDPEDTEYNPYIYVGWDPYRDDEAESKLPGSEGHCGIIGLRRPGISYSSDKYKSLRALLAEHANESFSIL